MRPYIFYQLTREARYQVLKSEGIFLRERRSTPYIIQLYLIGDYHYEMWLMSPEKSVQNIFYVSDEDASLLYEEKSEIEI
jgi:hypothetical protein